MDTVERGIQVSTVCDLGEECHSTADASWQWSEQC